MSLWLYWKETIVQHIHCMMKEMHNDAVVTSDRSEGETTVQETMIGSLF